MLRVHVGVFHNSIRKALKEALKEQYLEKQRQGVLTLDSTFSSKSRSNWITQLDIW